MYQSPRPLPYKPEGRPILYVPEDDLWMDAARRAAEELSTDHKHRTGAVVVRDRSLIGRAGNQAGFKHPALIRFHESTFCLRRTLGIPSGQKYWLCPGCASPHNHAEPLAIRDALRTNLHARGADLYLWGHWWCCEPCWKVMIAAGISNVYLIEGATERFSEHAQSAIHHV